MTKNITGQESNFWEEVMKYIFLLVVFFCMAGCNQEPIDYTEYCKSQGMCQPSGNTCIPSSEQDCQKSSGCKGLGRCGLATVSNILICVPTTKAMCEQSYACKNHGSCSLSRNRCVVVSDADCANVPYCLEHQQGCIAKEKCMHGQCWMVCAKFL